MGKSVACDGGGRRLPVRGDPVAVAANRDALFVTGSDDEPGLVALAGLAQV